MKENSESQGGEKVVKARERATPLLQKRKGTVLPPLNCASVAELKANKEREMNGLERNQKKNHKEMNGFT